MGVPLPAQRRHDLHTHRRDTIWQNLETVFFVLHIEDLEAGERHHTGVDLVIIPEVLDGFDTEADFRAGADERDIGIFVLGGDVAALDGVLDGRVFQLRDILSRQGDDAGCGL